MAFTLASRNTVDELQRWGGSKAASLSRLTKDGFPVPDWFCLSFEALRVFLRENHLQEDLFVKPNDLARTARDVEQLFISKRIPALIEEEIGGQLIRLQLMKEYITVRSSEVEEMRDLSAPEPYSTFLFQRGPEAVVEAVKRVWASAYSEKALTDRIARGLPLRNIRLGVVIQRMVYPEASGIALTRNPRRPRDRHSIEIRSVWGPTEGFEFEGKSQNLDRFTVNRESGEIKHNVGEKLQVLKLNSQGYPVRTDLSPALQGESSLTRTQVLEIAKMAVRVEDKVGAAQKVQWAVSEGKIYCLQSRPIPSLPPDLFYQQDVRGKEAVVWDRENLATADEVMRPLYFSLIREAARERQRQWNQWTGTHAASGEWLGLIRGRIYCNVIRWYESLMAFPNPALTQRAAQLYDNLKKDLPKETVPHLAVPKTAPPLSFLNRLKLSLLKRKGVAMTKEFEAGLTAALKKMKSVDKSLEAKAKAYRNLRAALIEDAQGPALAEINAGADILKTGPLNGLKDFKASSTPVAKAWQMVDQIFMEMTGPLVDLGVLAQPEDITFLTAGEILSYVEGTAVSTDLKSLVLARRQEYLGYERNSPPPKRVTTEGAASLWFDYPQVLAESAVVLKSETGVPSNGAAAKKNFPTTTPVKANPNPAPKKTNPRNSREATPPR